MRRSATLISATAQKVGVRLGSLATTSCLRGDTGPAFVTLGGGASTGIRLRRDDNGGSDGSSERFPRTSGRGGSTAKVVVAREPGVLEELVGQAAAGAAIGRCGVGLRAAVRGPERPRRFEIHPAGIIYEVTEASGK